MEPLWHGEIVIRILQGFSFDLSKSCWEAQGNGCSGGGSSSSNKRWDMANVWIIGVLINGSTSGVMIVVISVLLILATFRLCGQSSRRLLIVNVIVGIVLVTLIVLVGQLFRLQIWLQATAIWSNRSHAMAVVVDGGRDGLTSGNKCDSNCGGLFS